MFNLESNGASYLEQTSICMSCIKIRIWRRDNRRESVYKRFTDLGFKFVTIDIKGYRLGSMNATLNNGK